MSDSRKANYVIFLGCTAALGGLLFGFDIAIITGAGPYLTKEFALSDLGLGWAFSSLLFGCALGCVIAGRLTDRWGRKNMLLLIALLFACTSIETALAPGFTAFVTARFLAGLAVGGVSLLSPMYVAEVSPAGMRGRLGTTYQMSIIVGILISYALNYLLRNTGGNNWRWMFLTGVVPSAVFFLFVYIAPETPRFLVMRGRERDALAVLQRISGDVNADAQVEAIRSSLKVETRSWRGLLRPGVNRALIISVILAILVHFSGINTVIDYAPAIFQSAGWKIDSALASTFIVGLTEFLFTLVSFWVIDRYGRKPLYIVGSFGMALALIGLIAAVFANSFHGPVVLALILTYIAFFASCIGPVFWTLVPEIFPNDMRGLAMTFPVLTQWIANALVVLLFPYAFHVMGKTATFGFLAAMALAQGLFTWLCVPETGNKSLEEMESYLVAAVSGGIKGSDRSGD
ncbi:MAG: sugar porter family MFS transporter [Acidobacteria bacterium]|nr:sugar porter family MFS transporter [Acidobacteriota bacterium]